LTKTNAEPANDYVARTNAAIDHIVGNLDKELTLEAVAKVACFSSFHFHRIFRSLLGETLAQFVKRQRLERALYLMSHAPKRSLTEVALECGFASPSDFSRSFKSRFGTAPSVFDVEAFRKSRREEFESTLAAQENGPILPRLPAGENPDGFEVIIRDVPPRTVAYIRVLNPYLSDSVVTASERLMTWADKHDLEGQWLGYMWEDPEIVALEDCRYDVAVVVNESDSGQQKFRANDEVGYYQFPAMCVAEVKISGDIELEQRAIDWLFKTWLPRSGYEPDSQPVFESWNGRPFAYGFEHFELSCQLPIKK